LIPRPRVGGADWDQAGQGRKAKPIPGGIGEPEDAEPAQITAGIRLRAVVESII
jgi:hypothetical protein